MRFSESETLGSACGVEVRHRRGRERVDAFRGSPVCSPREECIEIALKNKLADRAAKRSLDAARAAKEIEEFTNEFKNAARECFQMIDTDGGGSLSTDEIVRAVKEDAKVIKFLKNCGEDNLQFLLHPPRLQKALAILDTDKSGEIDIDECTASRHPLLSQRFDPTRLPHRGGGDQPGPRQAAGGAVEGARARQSRGGQGRRGVLCGVPQRGP